tara:strand:- start:12 stop:422 length:411 start_codon:yes stop_codon:yes gene_type:complete
MNRPIPAPKDCFMHFGRLIIIFVRTLKITNMLNMTPDQNVAPNTVCHGMWYIFTAVNEKNIFIPIPGAITNGFLVNKPIDMLDNAEMMIVLVTSASLGIPVVDRILGFTIIMYEIAKKDAKPAKNYFFMDVLYSSR